MNTALIYRGLAAGCARFPLPVLHAISRVGNTLAIAAMRNTVRGLRQNLRVMGHDARSARRLARTTFHSFGHMMIDLFRVRTRGLGMVPPLLPHERDDSVLRRLPDPSRGCLLLTGHLGSWELGGAYLVQHGFRVAEMGQPELDPEIDALRVSIRERVGIEWIEIGTLMTTALQVRATIERGVHVALVCDRAYPEDSVVVDFFGRPTPFLRSPVRLARLCRCPIVPGYLLANPDGSYRSWFGEPLVIDLAAEPDSEDRRIMGAVAQVIEQGIREDPSQWYNFFDYWGRAGAALVSAPERPRSKERGSRSS
jgi:KDO2-lipid IV(A) lauroyltransferase